MPEGHTLHHLTRQHHRRFAGQVVHTSSPQGRFTDGAAVLDGQTLVRAEAKGKHAFYHFSGGQILHVHLGLYGRFRTHVGEPPPPRGAVRLRLIGDTRAWDLIGPTQCALMSQDAYSAKLLALGEDPLRDDADPERVMAKLGKTRRAIGAVLMDQSVIAGIGNVYRAELCFLANVSPWTPSRDVAELHADLWSNAVTLLRVGAKHNSIRVIGEEGVLGPRGVETVDPEAWTRASRFGPRRDRLYVYKRSTCKVCGCAITTETLAARKVYFCPECQR